MVRNPGVADLARSIADNQPCVALTGAGVSTGKEAAVQLVGYVRV